MFSSKLTGRGRLGILGMDGMDGMQRNRRLAGKCGRDVRWRGRGTDTRMRAVWKSRPGERTIRHASGEHGKTGRRGGLHSACFQAAGSAICFCVGQEETLPVRRRTQQRRFFRKNSPFAFASDVEPEITTFPIRRNNTPCERRAFGARFPMCCFGVW